MMTPNPQPLAPGLDIAVLQAAEDQEHQEEATFSAQLPKPGSPDEYARFTRHIAGPAGLPVHTG